MLMKRRVQFYDSLMTSKLEQTSRSVLPLLERNKIVVTRAK